eukprot:5573999-Alexandrium_andersonii.AAC.1
MLAGRRRRHAPTSRPWGPRAAALLPRPRGVGPSSDLARCPRTRTSPKPVKTAKARPHPRT